jgi:hypothetical protein
MEKRTVNSLERSTKKGTREMISKASVVLGGGTSRLIANGIGWLPSTQSTPNLRKAQEK